MGQRKNNIDYREPQQRQLYYSRTHWLFIVSFTESLAPKLNGNQQATVTLNNALDYRTNGLYRTITLVCQLDSLKSDSPLPDIVQ